MTLDDYLYYRGRVVEFDTCAMKRSGTKTPPMEATDFALRVSYVILSSGMKWNIITDIWRRLRPALIETGHVGGTFGHPGKKKSIEKVMAEREVYFTAFKAAWRAGPDEVIAFCETLPHIGKTTKFHLAKNLGIDVAKPDVWLVRVARSSGEGPQDLCQRLSRESGDRVATVDYVIWRACQQGWWRLPGSLEPRGDSHGALRSREKTEGNSSR